MDPTPLIFDISSDDESPAFSDPSGEDEDHNWLEDLLQTVDRETDESDDVVVVGEYNPPKPKLQTSRSSEPFKIVEDDDCVILDGDPDKPAATAENTAEDDDDVLVVGETGQVACRDYPHSRHLCLKFQFSSTLHAEHCDLCHCYVCDSLAPCAYWGTGLSSSDHCHATDKQQTWKALRESFRRPKDGLLTVPKAPNTLQKAVTQLNQIMHFENIIELAPTSEAQSQVRQPSIVRPCSSYGGVPNIISRSRTPQTGYNPGRNGPFPRRLPQPALGVRNNMIRRPRGSQIDNFGRQFISTDAMIKNQMFGAGAFMTNQPHYGTSDNVNIVSGATTYPRNPIPLVPTKDFDSCEQQNALPNMVSMGSICDVSSQPDITAVADALASLSEVYPRPVCQPISNQNVFQLDNRTTRVTDPTSLDFNFRWVDEMGIQEPSVEAFHQSGTMNDQSRVDHCSSQLPVNSQDVNYCSWGLGQSVPPATAGYVASDISTISTEPPTLDSDVLGNYFQTSWSGSTQN